MKLGQKVFGIKSLLLALTAGGLLLFATVIGCSSEDEPAGTGGPVTGTTGGTGGGAGGGGAPPASNTPQSAACQCWFDLRNIQLPSLLTACETTISDACVACTEGISGGASCAGRDETDFSDCLVDCLHLVPDPTTPEYCKEMTRAGTTNPEAISAGECMCDNCFDVYAPCIANTACLRVMLCVADTGCIGLECTMDPVCSPIISDAISADNSLIEPLSSTIANCSDANSCQAQTTGPAPGM